MDKTDGKVALVIGGASGLGAEDAPLLACEGAKIVNTDVQDALGANVAEEIQSRICMHHDVRDEEGSPRGLDLSRAEISTNIPVTIGSGELPSESSLPIG